MNKLYTVLFFSIFTGSTLVKPSINLNNDINDLVDIVESDNSDMLIHKSENFKFGEKAFGYYTKKVDTSVLLQLIRVCDYYGLANEGDFKMCVGQMLVESGGNHYKNGNVIIGSGGHIGMAQISPTTTLAVFNKIVTDDDFKIIKDLVNDTLMVKPKTHSESVKFLSDVNNNLVFWGYLMGRNIKLGNIESALVRYNVGPGGYKSYVNNGGSPKNHNYVKKIKNKLSKIN
jgi:hypothetical protein